MGGTMAVRRQKAAKAAKNPSKSGEAKTRSDLGIKSPGTKVPPSAQTQIKPNKKKG